MIGHICVRVHTHVHSLSLSFLALCLFLFFVFNICDHVLCCCLFVFVFFWGGGIDAVVVCLRYIVFSVRIYNTRPIIGIIVDIVCTIYLHQNTML